MVVIGSGRRGEGTIILGSPDQAPDIDAPLPSVVAFGVVQNTRGLCSISVREELAGQIEAEIVDPSDAAEIRRWTYSTWNPVDRCPQCERPVRTVRMLTEAGRDITLAICAQDRRLWVHEGRTGICRPVPVTLFYSELMRRTGVRAPEVALRSDRLFEALAEFQDDALTIAFAAYNRVRAKVDAEDPIRLPLVRRSLWRRLFTSSRT